jgi:FkbM family methyltransferase
VMPIISYAQNYEDVILFRALKDVSKGFYIDVGAMDPVEESVTKAFYDAGWNGINIEPLEQNYQKFIKDRPRDININCLAGDQSGEAVFYELVNTGLSTQDKVKAEELGRNNGYSIVDHSLMVDTLTNILIKVDPPTIHFLKIDVEGAEKAVLDGTDLKRFRPWIIVVESTIPNSPIQDYGSWEPYLLDNLYDFAYFDGLNRFYVAHEKSVLISEINIPPNVFDKFITIRELSNKKETFSILQLAEKMNKSLIEGFNQQQILLETNKHLASENTRLQKIVDSLLETQAKLSETKLLLAKAIEDNNSLILENQKLGLLESKVNNFTLQNNALQSEILVSSKERQAVLDELINVYSSKSFRLTRPLRAFARWLRKVGRKVFGIDYSKRKQPDTKESSTLTQEDLSGSEFTEDAKYFYGILKDFTGDKK